jgi:CRISPR-associated protein Cas4
MYHESPQTKGKLCHRRIEQGIYSTRIKYLQGTSVYSEKYRLAGKIDLYDIGAMTLIERKYKISKIYDGYRYQLYAQKLCLEEMGHLVLRMQIRSLADNRRYEIPVPDKYEWDKFEQLIAKVNDFSLIHDNNFKQNPNKCARCIYRELCDIHYDVTE